MACAEEVGLTFFRCQSPQIIFGKAWTLLKF